MAASLLPFSGGIDPARRLESRPAAARVRPERKSPPGRGVLAGLSLTLTERCNWRCRYCPRVRGTNTLEAGTLDQACAALFPYLSSSPLIQFCGGEPLLAFHLIRRAIEQLEKRSRDSRTLPRYSLTTNGSLLRPEVLSFLDAHRFALMLSFDGPSQDQERRKGSYRRLTALLDKLPAYPGIRPATNSVFGPRTVGTLADTIAFLVDRRVPEILVSFDLTVPWPTAALNRLSDGLRAAADALLDYARTGKDVPLLNLRRPPAPGIFVCPAGRDRLALDPEGRLWGCYRFVDFHRAHPRPDVLRRFCFGTVADFVRAGGNPDPRIQAAYSGGRMDLAQTRERPCAGCAWLDRCAFCPPAAAMKSGILGLVPVAHCRISRIVITERERFWRRAAVPES